LLALSHFLSRAFKSPRKPGDTIPPVARLIRIHSARSKPSGAFVTVYYRDIYFWIDDTDLPSKQMFALMTMFFTLADTGERENLPLITIPAR